jgi:hypothetical protein
MRSSCGSNAESLDPESGIKPNKKKKKKKKKKNQGE